MLSLLFFQISYSLSQVLVYVLLLTPDSLFRDPPKIKSGFHNPGTIGVEAGSFFVMRGGGV